MIARSLIIGIWLSIFCDSTFADDQLLIRDFVDNYCLECHSSDDPTANLDLEGLLSKIAPSALAKADTTGWEKTIRRLTTRQMPPLNAATPEESEYLEVIGALSRTLDDAAQLNPNPGRVGTMRRLTRVEYQNSIRDLLGVNIDAAEYLPKDESSHGFDNITVEELSPVSVNRYISAAQKISRLAMGGAGNAPSGKTVRIPADRSQENHVEGLPFGTRGGIKIKHLFAQTGEYEFELKLTRDRDEKVEGLFREHKIDILIDRERVHQFSVKPPRHANWESRDFTHVDSHLRVRKLIKSGERDVIVTFPKTFSSLVEEKRQPFETNYNRHRHPRKTPALFQVSIVGPFSPDGVSNVPSRKTILSEYHSEKGLDRSHAEKVLQRLTRRAFRRPITKADMTTPMKFFDESFDGKNFDFALESAISTILVNPNFLFRIEPDQADRAEATNPTTIRDLNNFELASRLAFFLWSSIPDEELLRCAEEGQLSDEQTLVHQVRRMLADEKSSSLVTNFASQWLYLRNLDSIAPDLRLYPDFDDNLRRSFRRETQLLFQDMMRRDGNVLDLIRSDFTYLNARLATHYGIENVQGSEFRKVKLDSASHRGGLLRHGSILMVTSYATRTSPTLRGSWVLENIVGTPPPPPPPNIPNLKENTQLDHASVRERLAAHRTDPACASCHDLIDPIGFALENYDAIGRWRKFDDSLTIDTEGVLPDGTEIDSVADLESAILERPDNFATTLTEKLFTFGIGRSVEPTDGPAIRKIVREASKSEFRFSSIITGIVLSDPFRKRSVK